MRMTQAVVAGLVAATLGADVVGAQTGARPAAALFEGARLIVGDGSPPIDNGAFLVQDGRIIAVGRRGAVQLPPGGLRVDLTGRTVMPAMINVHAHLGYEGYTTWGAANHTPDTLFDHLQREAYYGVAAATSVGSSPTEISLQFQRDQRAGKYLPAARYLFMPGMAPPNGGPDHILREATSALKVVNEVTTPAEARAAIRKMASQQIGSVKIWVDDRRGTYPKMTPDVYHAIIDEAHVHTITVHAHATTLADQKAVVGAGADVLVHMVQGQPLDEEYLTLLKQKRPYWATVIGLGDPVGVCQPDPFFEHALPPSVVAKIRATKERRPLEPNCVPAPNAQTREAMLAENFPKMIAAGARLVLGTDTGIHPGHTFGSGEHIELARWVRLGLPPAEAIVAATSRAAELLGLTDLGTLAAGKRASFIVLTANPLENILNTRAIADVYLDGVRFDRDHVRSRWTRQR
jgi:imidazolonepropionase-like amidohydrolase